MPKKEAIEVEGTVVEALPNAMFWVELANSSSCSGSYLRQNENALYPDTPGR